MNPFSIKYCVTSFIAVFELLPRCKRDCPRNSPKTPGSPVALKSRVSETAADLLAVDILAAFFPSLLLFFDLFAHLGDSLFVADRFPAFVADGSSKSLSS
jgi:hypothetical protein